jgi:hypothetical protein
MKHDKDGPPGTVDIGYLRKLIVAMKEAHGKRLIIPIEKVEKMLDEIEEGRWK